MNQKIHSAFILVFLATNISIFSQVKKLDTLYCDCNKAKLVSISGKTIQGKTIAPKGSGEFSEISQSKQRSRFTFEEEHNSAWYKLKVLVSGNLTFDVIPLKADDDYDFMLFRGGNNNFCDSLKTSKINPTRACISRDKKELEGKTGLNHTARIENVKQGVGSSYCQSIQVIKGEVYYLVLDNVYEKGEGHSIEFNITNKILFTGVVVDESKKAVSADISITNPKGDTIMTAKTSADGAYNFNAQLSSSISYSINFYNDSSFIYTKNFKVKDTLQLKNLETILPKLRKGSKYPVGTINFYGGSFNHIPQSLPAMRNLAKLLQKNKHLKIKIIGHSNGKNFKETDAVNIQFTLRRAAAIRTFIISQGIAESRVEIEGKGDSQMLFKLPQASEAQQEQNRRVEIMVLEY